jgi:hypothetical protein
MKQDKITINGPKNDGTYTVEFTTADGVALAFSVPKGGGTAVLEYSRTRCPMGSRCRMSHGVCHRVFTGSSPAVGAVPTKSRVFHRRPCLGCTTRHSYNDVVGRDPRSEGST